MNYNSIEEIFSSGTSNMTVLRDNTKQDDGTDTITGVDWFTFNGTVSSSIYASGNSWLGFGSSTEHLKVNRRDSALYSLYREEGTYEDYKFLKIRWDGYSAYNYTTSAYKITYDVILWSTGDISLYMVSIPTSSSNGTYSLVASSTYSYTVSSSSPHITFKKTDSGFEVQNNIINLVPPKVRYYVNNEGQVYDITSNSLIEIESADVSFNTGYDPSQNDGFDGNLLSELSSPTFFILQNTIKSPGSEIIFHVTPQFPQLVTYESETIPTGLTIKTIEALNAEYAVFTITFDRGSTWQYWNGNAWVTAATYSEGMDAEELKAVTQSQWEQVTTSDTYQVRCAFLSENSCLSNIAIKYA